MDEVELRLECLKLVVAHCRAMEWGETQERVNEVFRFVMTGKVEEFKDANKG